MRQHHHMTISTDENSSGSGMARIYHHNFLFGPAGRYDVGIECVDDGDIDPGDSHIVIHDTQSGEDRHYKLVKT